MNILQINTTDIRGGAAKVAYRLKTELEKTGHQTTMFVGEKFSQENNVYILNNKKGWVGRVRKKLAYWLANDIDLFSSDKILKMEAFRCADIVHCHNLHSYFFNLSTLEKMSKLKPVVWTMHDMWPITAHCAHAFGGKVKDGFFQCPSLDIFPPLAWHNEKYLQEKKRKIYSNSKFHIIVPSLWLKNKVEQSLLGGKPISLIYNGIDTKVFKPYVKGEVRRELGLPPEKKIVLTAIKRGQSNPWKGHDYIRDVREKYREDSNLLFLNIGTDIPFIKDEATLAKYYSAADVLLYPSLADNCPLVVLEAQSCGLPVVAFKTGGIPELIAHATTGYLAEYKDIQDLIRKLRFVLDLNESALNEMKKNAHIRVQEGFSLDQMTDQYIKLYQKLLVK